MDIKDQGNAPLGRGAPVRLSGEYDISRQSELEAALGTAIPAPSVVLDMSDVSYMDSTALTCLIALHKRIIEKGSGVLRLEGVRPNIRRILSVTKLDEIFELADDNAPEPV